MAATTEQDRLKLAQGFYASHEELFRAFPIKYPDGFTLEELDFYCPACQCCAQPQDVRGGVRWLTPHVIHVEAVAICRPCLMYFNCEARFRSEQGVRRIEEMVDGQWVAYIYGTPWWITLWTLPSRLWRFLWPARRA